MRIISKYQDYYDSVLAYGHDDTLTYVRKPEETLWDNEHIEKAFRTGGRLNSNRYDQYPFLLGFCGSFYYGLRVAINEWQGNNDFLKVFYSEDQVWDYIQRISCKVLRNSEMNSYSNKNYPAWAVSEHRFKKFFSRVHPDSDDMFFELGCPVFLITPSGKVLREEPKLKIKTNPCLKDLQFFKVMDSFQTFQKIDQYLGGVLGQAHPPMVQISDVDMRDKKGFDEYSFKKLPTKKR